MPIIKQIKLTIKPQIYGLEKKKKAQIYDKNILSFTSYQYNIIFVLLYYNIFRKKV